MMTRRDFNQLAAGFATHAALGGLLSSCATKPLIPLDAVSYGGSKGRLITASPRAKGKCLVRIVDWDTYRYDEFDIPLDLVHSIVQDHADRHVLYFFEIFGSAAKVDMRTGSITKIDHKQGKAMFNGHGTLSADNDFIACTEIDSKTGTTVRLRSTKDLSVIDELPPLSRSCHQIITLPGSTILASGNTYANGGAIVFYDYRKREYVGQFKTPNRVVHLVATSPTEALATCMADRDSITETRFTGVTSEKSSLANLMTFTKGIKPTPAPLAFSDLSGKGRLLFEEAKKDTFVVNYGLSKAPGGRFISSHSESNKVLIWKDFKIEREIDVPTPKNVQLSDEGSEFVVIAGSKLQFYSLKTYEMTKQLEDWPGIQTISSYT